MLNRIVIMGRLTRDPELRYTTSRVPVCSFSIACDRDYKPENGERLYELIYLTFIAPEKLSHKELLYRLNMSSRSYYRLREQAITILSIRLWAAPTTEADFWLDMLTLLEST